MFTVGVTVDVPVTVTPVPPSTFVTVPAAESVPVTVSVLPLLVTPTVPAPVIITSSLVPSEPASLTPAVPFNAPTPDRS